MRSEHGAHGRESAHVRLLMVSVTNISICDRVWGCVHCRLTAAISAACSVVVASAVINSWMTVVTSN